MQFRNARLRLLRWVKISGWTTVYLQDFFVHLSTDYINHGEVTKVVSCGVVETSCRSQDLQLFASFRLPGVLHRQCYSLQSWLHSRVSKSCENKGTADRVPHCGDLHCFSGACLSQLWPGRVTQIGQSSWMHVMEHISALTYDSIIFCNDPSLLPLFLGLAWMLSWGISTCNQQCHHLICCAAIQR